jgi:LuxR family maltose regulon positive regulatory protein
VESEESSGALGTAARAPGSPAAAASSAIPDPSARRDIERARLTDRLLCSPPAALVVLSAPAGYSKTTTLRSWAQTDRRPFLWVSCDRRHDDPAFLISSIATEAAQLTSVEDEEVAAMAIEANWPEMALPRLAGLLGRIGVGFAIVLDDAHLLKSEGSIELLQGLLEVLPSDGQLVIGSRGSPPIQLGRMRANRNLLELGRSDLAMTRRESQRLLRAAGLELQDHQLEALFLRTEGWPAALYLASLSLNGQADMDRAVEDFSGDDRDVAEYLRDEFLASSDPDLLEFLVRTSLLETLNGPLCDAALQRTGSASVLRELADSNALVVPLDRTGDSFRYHHLFADMLRSELRRTEPEIARGIHARASLWYEAQGQAEAAVEHAIASGDSCVAGHLVWESLPELSGRGRVATLNRWLDEVGRERLAECHGLLFTAAHTSLISGAGDEAAYWIDLASDLVPSEDCTPESERDLLMLKATFPRDGADRMGADAAGALQLSAPDSVWRGAATFYLGVSTHILGDPAGAVGPLRDAVRLTAVASPVIQSLARAQLSLISLDGGEREEAIRLISEARSQVDRCGLARYPAMVLVYSSEALICAREGLTGRSLQSLEAGHELLGLVNGFPSWYEAETRLGLSETSFRLGDNERGRRLLSQARVHFERSPDSVFLGDWLERLEAELDTRTAETADPATTLTRAELRTLRYLPTHLSFKQIGDANDLSPNTVKTQARSIYRKLGASSRSEAVEQARLAGLLEVTPP